MPDRNGPQTTWAAGRSPLAETGWKHVEALPMDAFRASDWALLDRQRRPYYAARQADQVLAMLAASADEPRAPVAPRASCASSTVTYSMNV